MILELAAGYGAMRACTDLINWLARRQVAKQAQSQNLVPVQQGQPQVYRNAETGRFQRMQAPEMQPVYSGAAQETDFEIFIRGQTRDYR